LTAGDGSASVAISPFLRNMASCWVTRSSDHPEWLCPILSRTTALLLSSRKIAMAFSPVMAPTKVSASRSGCTTTGDGGELLGGGRRLGEKIGRSRVAVKDCKGIAHNGFGRSLASCEKKSGTIERAGAGRPLNVAMVFCPGAEDA